MLRKIERINAREAKRDFKNFVVTQTPVIILDLYSNESLLNISSPVQLAEELGDIELTIGSNYYDKFLSDEPSESKFKDYVITLKKYLDSIMHIPEIDLLCREQRLPAMMQARFAVPDLIQVLPNPDAVQMMYVANDRTVAPLHFDGDFREVLFTQIVGKKKIYLVEPRFSARLNPIKNFSGIPIHRFEENEKDEFFAFNHAYHCHLDPRETLYIPKLWWHQLENQGITMAASVRFGTTSHNKLLQSLPLNYLTQNIARELFDPITGESRNESVFKQLVSAVEETSLTENHKTESLLAILKNIYSELCPSSVQIPYLSSWFENEVKNNAKKFELLYGTFKGKA